jgi:tetratricopeptide (TPR) repeat protein
LPPQELFHFFEKMTLQKLHLYFRTHNLSKAWSVFRRLESAHPDDFTKMLSACSLHSLPMIALDISSRVVDKMISSNINLDHRDYHSLLAIRLRAKRHDEAISIFQNMYTTSNLKPDVISYNLLMAVYLELQDLPKLIETWEECISAHPASRNTNLDGWAFLIHGNGQANNLHTAIHLYNYISDFSSSFNYSQVVDSAMIRAYGLNQASDKAIQLFEKITKNVYSYDSIIEACLSDNNYDATLSYWNELLEFCADANETLPKGAKMEQPLCTTIFQMIKLYHNLKDPQKVKLFFDYHWSANLPDVDTVKFVISSLCELGRRNSGKEVYHLCIKRGYPLDDMKAKYFSTQPRNLSKQKYKKVSAAN